MRYQPQASAAYKFSLSLSGIKHKIPKSYIEIQSHDLVFLGRATQCNNGNHVNHPAYVGCNYADVV